ncbi:Carboxylic ester hydrolase [Mycena venus]|uniref:Carboxylic ester hydrolase n=1 Tax=Mycena venus TaxID=2733690 RepID=A0A8H6YET7_9AGAR|nr:Carboxylic ester hydrolase [Mycena venus]
MRARISLSTMNHTSSVAISTTSGKLHGAELNGVMSFKGVRFARAPTDQLRWEPPVPFVSAEPQNATVLGPSCLQQFAFATGAFTQFLFNDPPPASENEDCLFLNVWAPSTNTKQKKPVLFWIYGGDFIAGTASYPIYDGSSLAANQDIVVVTSNYRTNVFGFPSAPDFPITQNNLGFLDQELALEWVQLNIAQFGGDPDKVTIVGQSAGADSVGLAIVRDLVKTPFRAGVMLSGAPTSASPIPSFTSFDAFAVAVPAATIRNFTNGPLSGSFGPVVDNVTVFADPLERLRGNATANVPIIIGNMENDGTAFTVGETNLTAFLGGGGPGMRISPALVQSLYPGQNDSVVIADAFRDRGPAELWSAALIGTGVSSVFRYSYGAVFADLQKFPGAGAWHSSEIGPLFGTFNRSTATPAEAAWSGTFQTAIANFIKDPTTSPALNWQKYVPGPPAATLAKLAYSGNLEPGNFVDPVPSGAIDGPCDSLWDAFLDITA